MQYWGHTYAKKQLFIVYLKIRFARASGFVCSIWQPHSRARSALPVRSSFEADTRCLWGSLQPPVNVSSSRAISGMLW